MLSRRIAGKVYHQVVAMIAGMHPDVLEPCEAPPGGDMTMPELADVTHGEIILMGNLQGRGMENAPVEEIKRQVVRLIQEMRGKAPFILSWAPICLGGVDYGLDGR